MRIRFTPSAEAQLNSAIEYIRRDRPSAAVAYAKRAREHLSRLTWFPNSGRTVPEYPSSSVREVVVSPCRFFYQQKDDDIWILAVWHEAQLPDEPTR